MEKMKIDQRNIVFAMDIGTRSVVGIVGTDEGDKLRVIDVEILEHENRSMMDGQVHDVAEVAKTARVVKERLEKRLGFKLEHVCIAAAGRALRTVDVQVTKEIESMTEVTREHLAALEVEGLLKAQETFNLSMKEKESSVYYCVGHSVTDYSLDGCSIKNLMGHRGKSMGVSMIATFLPAPVMDSLNAVVQKIGLSVSYITLEPIAAIQVAIPKDLRILNLALVDIGAGTTDIAITNEGSVTGFSMVPVAGDEISECISQHFLVDFKMAEKMKIDMGNGLEEINYMDILGKKKVATTRELEETIRPAIDHLAEVISDRILEQNKRPTKAVFMIGGGSRLKGICSAVAQKLGMPEERVVVQGRDIITEIQWDSDTFTGPESITPFGIAVTGMRHRENNFLSVWLNNEEVKLLSVRNQTVGDAVLIAGFQPGQLIGRSGKSLSFHLNGKKKVVRGEPGKPAEIFINGNPGSLDSEINSGDKITIKEAVRGKDARIYVKDYIQSIRRGSVQLNGKYRGLEAKVFVNGKAGELKSEIFENDNLEIVEMDNIAKLMEAHSLVLTDAKILVNGTKASATSKIRDGDEIVIQYENAKQRIHTHTLPAVKEEGEDKTRHTSTSRLEETIRRDRLIETLKEESKKEESKRRQTKNSEISNAGTTNVEIINKQDKTMGDQPVSADSGHKESIIDFSNNLPSSLDQYMKILVNQKEFYLERSNHGYFFVEVLSHLNFTTRLEEGALVLKLNGMRAGFTDPVMHGDKIEIYWEK